MNQIRFYIVAVAGIVAIVVLFRVLKINYPDALSFSVQTDQPPASELQNRVTIRKGEAKNLAALGLTVEVNDIHVESEKIPHMETVTVEKITCYGATLVKDAPRESAIQPFVLVHYEGMANNLFREDENAYCMHSNKRIDLEGGTTGYCSFLIYDDEGSYGRSTGSVYIGGTPDGCYKIQ